MKNYKIITTTLIIWLAAHNQLRASRPAELKEQEENLAVQGVSFRDYYRAHKTAINSQVSDRKSLELRNENIKDLTDFDGEHVPHLTEIERLNISFNPLITLHAGVFNGFTELEYLWLPGNKFNTLPAGIFHDMKRLKYLALENNQLVSLPAGIFDELAAVEVLNLSDNQLATFPAGIFNKMKNLTSLRLYNNPIPITQEQLQKELQLPAKVELYFKTPTLEKAEQDLFIAIKNGDIATVRQQYSRIMTGKIRSAFGDKIDISKIRDTNGSNLLHMIVQAASKRPQADYLKIFMTLTQFGGPKIQEMLLTRNKNGDDVLGAAIGALGKDNALVTGLRKFEHAQKPAGVHAQRFPIKPRPVVEKTETEKEEIEKFQAEQRRKLE